jgi:lysophospholipase
LKNFKQSPLFNDVSHGPPEYVANWVVTKDKIRIRVGLWNAKTPVGTVFICPGYSEYIEKYGKNCKTLLETWILVCVIGLERPRPC